MIYHIYNRGNNRKRLLGLAFFHCGAQNAVQMLLWATWILYAVLVDLSDEVAQQLNFLADHAKELGILKAIRSDKPSRLRSLQLTMAQNP